ncbi:MAG: hypothetical protein EBS89_09640 [Proteobacteria bacterium]|nr:hypothetical protein [Pseudomonadota bacterium]
MLGTPARAVSPEAASVSPAPEALVSHGHVGDAHLCRTVQLGARALARLNGRLARDRGRLARSGALVSHGHPGDAHRCRTVMPE